MKESPAGDVDLLKKAQNRIRDSLSKVMLELLTVETQNVSPFQKYPEALNPTMECLVLVGVGVFFFTHFLQNFGFLCHQILPFYWSHSF